MKLENGAYTDEQAKNTVAELAERARDFSGMMKDKLDDASQELRRGVRRAKAATADAMEDARHGIKSRPLTAVAVTAGSALAVGMLAGWLFGMRRRSAKQQQSM
jgi:ElaB/YqjD/DUF883 family membrane-anchored ribosome-binding protein